MFKIKSFSDDLNNDVYESHVSTVPATRLDVLSVKDKLDTSLHEFRARETGICPVRRYLYDQCFDEIIRQVTVESIDRGLLLYGIRNELKMTLMSTDLLRDSAVGFGLRTALRYNFNDIQCKHESDKLKEENELLRNQLSIMEKQLAVIGEEKDKILDELDANHRKEVKQLNSIITNQRLLRIV
ncbi:33 kDa inner dynein arm light chain, axonemal-like [Oppia nitens]|uniref:33 kDa inner dynein arm light chain, axonemal-like n=1 Tax=Oppia nitens TaxID=1686743 RepID=UPI0023DB710C|nr:33 kDa inner dynein arm light chain, axonemal-like [Oppia nitens]